MKKHHRTRGIVLLAICLGAIGAGCVAPGRWSHRMDDPPALSPYARSLQEPPSSGSATVARPAYPPSSPHDPTQPLRPQLGTAEPLVPTPQETRIPDSAIDDVELLDAPGHSGSGLSGPTIIPQRVDPTSRIDLNVQVASTSQIGSPLTYLLIVRNSSDETVEDVVVESEFDEAILFPGRREKRVRQSFEQLLPRETKEIPLTLLGEQVGRHCVRFSVSSEGVEEVWKSVCVDFIPRLLDAGIVGPTLRTVGSRAEYTVKVINRDESALENVNVTVTYDASLKPREGSAGAVREPGRLQWDLGTLNSGEGVQLQVEFECDMATEQACLTIGIQADNVPDERLEACLRVVPVSGLIDLQASDTEDPVQVGDETEYVVTAENQGLHPLRDIQLHASIPGNFRIVSTTVRRDGQEREVGSKVQGQQIEFDKVETLPRDGRLEYRITVKAIREGDGEFRTRIMHALIEAPIETNEWTTVNPAP